MESEGSQPVAPTVHSYDLRSARRPDDVPPTDARGIRATQESAPMPPRMAADPDQDLGQEQQQQPLHLSRVFVLTLERLRQLLERFWGQHLPW